MSVTVVKNDNKVSVNKQQSVVTVNKNTTAAAFSAFNAAGDSGTSQITNNETLTLTGGTGITTSVSGDTVTFSVTDAEVLLQNEDINGGQY
jgi:hypothetical protein